MKIICLNIYQIFIQSLEKRMKVIVTSHPQLPQSCFADKAAKTHLYSLLNYGHLVTSFPHINILSFLEVTRAT